MDQQNKPLLLKVTYKNTKLKFQVNDGEDLISSLKSLIVQRLQSEGLQVEIDTIECQDADGFKLSNQDKINSVLKENDIVTILDKLPDNIKQQQQQEQQQQQQQQQQPQLQQQFDQNQQNIEQAKQPQETVLQQQLEDPVEAIVVIYDISGSMGSSFYGDKDLPRMGAVNAFFSAFADKTLAYELNHIVKLVCFSSLIVDKCAFTNDFNEFIKLVDGCRPGGGTKCYDAIDYAINQLLEIRQKYPKIVLRIIALTDGEDNQSQKKPQDIVSRLVENQIIIDSFVVSKNCQGLKTLTHATGGRCYSPDEINQGLQLFEIITILSVSQREQQAKVIDKEQVIDLQKLKDLPFDVDGLPAAKPKGATDQAMKREEIIQQFKKSQAQDNSNQGAKGPGVTSQGATGGGAQKRIYKELDSIYNEASTLYKVYPTTNIFSWRVILLGPKNSVYEKGQFILSFTFPQDYPFKPPKVVFLNKVYHCNISRTGGICIDILKDSWSPALTSQKVILSLHNLLTDPNPDDALESSIAATYKHDRQLFDKTAKQEVAQHATFGIGLVQQALGEGVDMASQQYQDTLKEITDWLTQEGIPLI